MNEIELLKNISMSEWKAHACVLCCTAINRTILLLISLVLINIWYVHILFYAKNWKKKQ